MGEQTSDDTAMGALWQWGARCVDHLGQHSWESSSCCFPLDANDIIISLPIGAAMTPDAKLQAALSASFSYENFVAKYNSMVRLFVPTSQCSWNSNGLLTKDPNIYGRKARRAKKLSEKHDFGLYQEVHGDTAELDTFQDSVPDHRCFHSIDKDNPNQGGLLTTVSHDSIKRISKQLGHDKDA